MTGSSGKEDSRQAKHSLGNWSVNGSEGLWQQISGLWCSAVLTACSGLNSCSQSSGGLCTLYTGSQQNSWGPVYLHKILVVCLCVFPLMVSCPALFSLSPSQSCESGPFSWGQAVVFLISYGQQWFCPLSSEVIVQINTCKWNQWR